MDDVEWHSRAAVEPTYEVWYLDHLKRFNERRGFAHGLDESLHTNGM